MEIVDGCRVLCSVIGFDNTEKKNVERSLKEQKVFLKKLATHADVSPQNVHKSFTLLVHHILTFLARISPKTEELLN